MRSIILLAAFAVIGCFSGCSQTANQQKNKVQVVGDGCDGCEVINESPVAFNMLRWVDTLPDYFENGAKMEISGVAYNLDGTPAKDVVLYLYHTDQTGHYSTKGNETGWRKRHGYIYSWIKTNELGQYKFYTLKPAAYPQRSNPAHIHVFIMQPGFNAYYIDDFVFDDDPLLTMEARTKPENRGGSGILILINKNGVLNGKRNILLGKNIPGYPKSKS